MLFSYKAKDQGGVVREGTVDAQNVEAAIRTVESRGYQMISIEPLSEKKSILGVEITLFQGVSNREVVILSRQIATLFDAQVSALRVFRLLASEAENPVLRRVLQSVADDLQGGSTISRALSHYPDVFSSFYVSLVKAGEESGTLNKTFLYLAGYLDRMYQVASKVRNALMYPAFVIGIFILVMTLMLTVIIPRISEILLDSGQELPIYTKVFIFLSDFVSQNIGFIFLFVAVSGVLLWQFQKTETGAQTLDEFKLSVPYLGTLYQKLYLARICDNLATMLQSGVSMVHALEVTAEVVDNATYREIIQSVLTDVKGGRSFADAIGEYPEIPGILSQMSRVGDESGNLGEILMTLATFYTREVDTAVDTLISLIEPVMIVLLGLGVGALLASVLIPIYNMTTAF